MESRFCKRIDCSYVTLLTTYPVKKTMFKVSNTNTRKICLCCQIRRPVISTILESYMSFFKKWEIITEIFDSWKIQNVSIFYFWNNNTKYGNIFQIFTLYSKGHHFSITRLDILIFCNMLHLEMDFWKLSWKGMVSSQTFWQKPREKQWDVEKME